MRLNSIRNGQRALYVLAATGMAVIGLSARVSACPVPTPTATPERTTYTVTDDESTSVDLNIRYSDNLDYEIDAADRLNSDGTDTICELIAKYAGTYPRIGVTYYHWYECTVPANEAPRTPTYS